MPFPLHKQRTITTSLSDSEVLKILGHIPSKKATSTSDTISFNDPTFYRWTITFNQGSVVLTIEPKIPVKIFMPVFLLLMVFGITEDLGWGAGIGFTLIFFLFMLFVNNGLMTTTIDEKEQEIINHSKS